MKLGHQIKFAFAAALAISAALRGAALRGQAAGAPEAPAASAKSAKAKEPNHKQTKDQAAVFRTSDRCVACHNGMKSSTGDDFSIGNDWRASIMANSSRDPYWQGSIRRESIDHPQATAAIEDECSSCHMPVTHFADHAAGRKAEVFSHLPLTSSTKGSHAAADGVSCGVCHQIEPDGLGTDATFSGKLKFAGPENKKARPEYGPYVIDAGHQRVMQTSTAGFLPIPGQQIRDAALCASCHTLYTQALGDDGKEIATFPEQMPYKEWLHSDYSSAGKQQTCQACHMPEIKEAQATALYGEPRPNVRRHVFVGANFVMEGMLNDHRDDLHVEALPSELDAAMKRTSEFMRTQAARVSLPRVASGDRGLAVDVLVQNLSGHKLPTAYPSRRAWLHVVVRDGSGKVVFESGALHPDGSIAGNDNDEDPLKFEPHYTEITRPDQVEIFEPILGDGHGHVTTGLLKAVNYLKDNRLLPTGFDKASADHDIAVTGAAASDPGFTDRGSLIHYVVPTAGATGPFQVEAELWYQPIGFRWAHNLEPYIAAEPKRFVDYYKAASGKSAMVLAKAAATAK